jgi:hypothetical protein
MATSKRKTKQNLLTLERHPASALFPDHDEATFRRLKKDIEANGLKQKIDVDADWRVVDGWHRYTALRELASEKGVSLKPECFNVVSGDATQVALTSQLARRNLSPEQTAAVLLKAGLSERDARLKSGLAAPAFVKLVRLFKEKPYYFGEVLSGAMGVSRATTQAFGIAPKPEPSNDNQPTPDRSFVQGRTQRAKIMKATGSHAKDYDNAPDHLVIPDTQAKPGVPLVHMKWIAMYAAQKRPAKIIHLGDHFDLPSLSSYDKGTKRAEGKRLSRDIAAGVLALRIFNETLAVNAPDYAPEKHMLTGNHEIRLQRHIDASPELDGALGMTDLRREEFGWTVHDFLGMSDIDGVMYSHYFCHNAHGRVVQSKRGQPSAREQIKRIGGVSCVAGHAQSLDVHYQSVPALGGIRTGIIAGSCYMHDEEYLTPQGEDYWRGVLMLNNVVDGEFALWCVGLDWLCRRYEGKSLKEFLATAKDSELMIADV